MNKMTTETIDNCVAEQAVKPYQSIGVEPLYDAQKVFGIEGERVFELAEALDKFKPDNHALGEISRIPDFLEGFRKKSDEEDLSDLSEYRVLLNRGNGRFHLSNNCNFYDNSVYRDAAYNFLLAKGSQLLANLGFETCPNSILIEQIQGVYGEQKNLAPIKWPRALIRIATDWARKNHISKAYVLPFERNRWRDILDDNPGAKLFYDVSAKKEGFRYDSEKQVYAKRLNRVGGRE